MSVKLLALVVPITTAVEIARITTGSSTLVGLQIKNSGVNPFSVFEIHGRVTEDAADVVLLSLATDYTGPVFPCVRASASPVTLAAAGTTWMLIDATPFSSLSIWAASSVGASTMNLYASSKAVF